MCLGRYYPILGGPGRSAYILSQELANRGIQVFVVARKFAGLRKVEKISSNHVVYRVDSFSERYGLPLNFSSLSISLFKMAAKLIRKHRISIFHSHEISYGAVAGLLLNYINRTPKVLKYGGDLVFEYLSKARPNWNPEKGVVASWLFDDFGGRLAFLLQKSFLLSYTHIYANSEYGYKILQNMSIPEKKISLIENGVVLDDFVGFSNSLRNKYDINGNILLAGGRFVRWKGFDVAIKALGIVLERHPKTYLILVGEGEEKAKLNKLAMKECANHVIFAGPVPFEKMKEYFSASDIFLLPSRYDVGLPNILLEAMASKVPVIASNIDAVRKIIENGKTGWLTIPGDPKDLADKINIYLDDKEKAKEICESARRLVERNYDHRKMVDKIVDLYENLMT